MKSWKVLFAIGCGLVVAACGGGGGGSSAGNTSLTTADFSGTWSGNSGGTAFVFSIVQTGSNFTMTRVTPALAGLTYTGIVTGSSAAVTTYANNAQLATATLTITADTTAIMTVNTCTPPQGYSCGAPGTSITLARGSNPAAPVSQTPPIFVPVIAGATPRLVISQIAMALKSDGTVLTWGGPYLGDGSSAIRYMPTVVPKLNNVIAVAGQAGFNMVLKSDGTVMTWGDNSVGQLGNGTTINQLTPELVPGLAGVATIVAGGSNAAAIKSDGTVLVWGVQNSGVMGDGINYPLSTTAGLTFRLSPAVVPTLTNVVSLALGNGHAVALKSDGTVMTWGGNGYGQLGDGTKSPRLRPTIVPGLTNVVAIAAINMYTMALKSDGTVLHWGTTDFRWGSDGTGGHPVPTFVPGLSNVVAVAAGYANAAALKSDGTLMMWGANEFGQLGNGTTAPNGVMQLSPTAVPGLSNVVAVALNSQDTAVIKSDGTMMAWGRNVGGLMGDGTTITRLTPVLVGGGINLLH
jgi:alpha-tubulin suppressor-like RCC1 family protein